jgi:hypothetical protein
MKVVLGDGLLGSSVIGLSGWHYISRSKDDIDITKPSSWKNLIPIGTTEIINLIANTNTYSNDVRKMYDVNYHGVVSLVQFCNDMKIKLVHYSTDYVYEGSTTNAKETYKEKPTTHYAISKWLADRYIIEHSDNYLICRGSQKPDPFPYESAWSDLMGNFDYPDVIAEIFIKMIKNGATGLYNIGTETKSMYDLAKQTNPNVISIIAPSHVPKDVTMDLTKMKQFLDGKE